MKTTRSAVLIAALAVAFFLVTPPTAFAAIARSAQGVQRLNLRSRSLVELASPIFDYLLQA